MANKACETACFLLVLLLIGLPLLGLLLIAPLATFFLTLNIDVSWSNGLDFIYGGYKITCLNCTYPFVDAVTVKSKFPYDEVWVNYFHRSPDSKTINTSITEAALITYVVFVWLALIATYIWKELFSDTNTPTQEKCFIRATVVLCYAMFPSWIGAATFHMKGTNDLKSTMGVDILIANDPLCNLPQNTCFLDDSVDFSYLDASWILAYLCSLPWLLVAGFATFEHFKSQQNIGAAISAFPNAVKKAMTVSRPGNNISSGTGINFEKMSA